MCSTSNVEKILVEATKVFNKNATALADVEKKLDEASDKMEEFKQHLEEVHGVEFESAENGQGVLMKMDPDVDEAGGFLLVDDVALILVRTTFLIQSIEHIPALKTMFTFNCFAFDDNPDRRTVTVMSTNTDDQSNNVKISIPIVSIRKCNEMHIRHPVSRDFFANNEFRFRFNM